MFVDYLKLRKHTRISKTFIKKVVLRLNSAKTSNNLYTISCEVFIFQTSTTLIFQFVVIDQFPSNKLQSDYFLEPVINEYFNLMS